MHTDPIQPLFIGQHRVNLPSCHSTNRVATDLLSSGNARDGTVVITDHQTEGKGQRGSYWESEAYKNLTFSLILYPHFLKLEQQFLLTQVTSLAVFYTLKDLGIEAKIKWPNDIYCNERKIAGILIENTVHSGVLQATVIGVGLNINQKEFNTPNATSIRLQINLELEIETVLQNWLTHFRKLVTELNQNRLQPLRTAYISNLYRLNQWHIYRDIPREKSFKGMIIGVDTTGKLEIRGDSGVQHYNFKQIEFVQ